VQADANGGWTVDEACDIIGRFDDARIIWEEPCSRYEDNVAVARKTARHVMVDQCVGDLDAAIRAIDERAAQSLCIKPAPLGGLTIARRVRDHAIEAGMRARIDGPWCGDIAAAAILHLALGMPSDLLISGCDLREPVAVPFSLNGVRHTGDGRIAPPAGLGLGVDSPEKLLGPPEKSIGAA
jgi:L-alanine-DL-glutamate epimerase-like enolase superfamily enzyme